MNVSVIVATFGDRKWEKLALDRAVPSAHGQSATEIIPLHLEEATLAEARNRAAQKAEADWLCFLDADDELAPGYLDAMRAHYHVGFEEQLRRAMKEPIRATPSPAIGLPTEPLELLVPAVQYIRRSERPKRGIASIENTYPPVMLDQGRPLYEINWAPIGTLVPRDLFFRLGGFRELAALEDWELWLRCERAGARLTGVPNAVYRVHVQARSRNSDQRLYRQIRAEYERAA